MRPVSLALFFILGFGLAAASVRAQTNSEEIYEPDDPPTPEAPAEPEETAPAADADGADADGSAEPAGGEAAAVPEPDYNGQATGVFITAPLNVPVVCTGMGSAVINAKSDPSGAPGQDVNGDGTVVDVSATVNGDIQMNMLAGGLSLNFNDTGAVVDGNTITYAITASITGGVDEKIDLRIVCN
ncbi:MAG: hypothetical protein AAGE38_15405 [Pseudomonadota bacterium]